jgi:proline-specific peptidase
MWTCDELIPDLCDLKTTSGFLTIRDINVAYWKYTSKVEDPLRNDNLLPIIAIHGGPAFLHNYMLPLKQQACRGRDIYFYDQAGCGESSVPSSSNTSVKDDFPWLLTTSYYAEEELPALVSHLGLTKFHIIANSWGTVLSQYFALDTNPKGLASMVLSGPFSDADLYIKSQWDELDGTIGSLPPFVQARIHKLEADKAYDSQEYAEINEILTTKFTCRTAPLPDCFVHSENNINTEIYVGMQGASEFTIGGVLGDLNITHRLTELQDLPVLLTHGQYDTMRPAVVQAMYDAIPVAETLLLKKSGHVSMIDEPLEMNSAIADFFDRVESKSQFIPRGFSDASIETGKPKAIDSHLVSIVILLVFGFISGVLVGRRPSCSRGQYSRVP